MLKLYGQARISMGISISDGVPNSMLEAMVMGAFPVESTTSCANEWIREGINGFIVPPEDPRLIAEAMSKALTDDQLVNKAAEHNARIIRERMDSMIIQPKVIAMYEQIAAGARIHMS
jgi:glycosyltransferase involved in cell wall biosynthesis